MKLKVGDCCLFNNGGFYSFVIRLHDFFNLRFSKATHAGIVCRVEKNGVWIREAIENDGPDFDEYYYEYKWLEKRVAMGNFIVRRPKMRLTNVRRVCESYEDFEYDWASIFLMPFSVVFSTPKVVFCSEAVARIYYDTSKKQLNISKELNKHYEKLTPTDLYRTKLLETVYE